MIYLMHGVVRPLSSKQFTHMWMLDAEQFESFLACRRPFKTLATALEGGGDALTIDDATCAARDAALLARKYGHQVTLFVNSDIVQHSDPYYLHALTALIGAATEHQLCRLPDHLTPSEIRGDRAAIRGHLKHTIARIRGRGARKELIKSIADALNIQSETPGHLQTLRVNDLTRLIECGVHLENHGADHAHFSIYNDEEVKEQIRSCKIWLQDTFQAPARYFAVPFGDVLPRLEIPSPLASYWFLAQRALRPGYVGPAVYNRKVLKF